MTIRPNFYDRFRCRAGGCGHTCCRGWEIDVDPDAAARYQSCPGALGDALRANLDLTAEGASFRLTAAGDCPFLRPDGLCRLICERGEDFLCEICREHPRFYADAGEDLLCGLGLSCEAAAALLLQTPDLYFIAAETGARFSLRTLCGRLSLRADAAAFRFVPVPDAGAVLDALSPCEAIDERWPRELDALRAALPSLRTAAAALFTREAAAAQRIFDFIAYRQLPLAEDLGLPAVLAYARLNTTFILCYAARFGSLAEAVRRWSEEIEYSDVNPALMIRRNTPG